MPVAPRREVDQEFAASAVQGDTAQLANDQQLGPTEPAVQPAENSGVTPLHKLADQRSGTWTDDSVAPRRDVFSRHGREFELAGGRLDEGIGDVCPGWGTCGWRLVVPRGSSCCDVDGGQSRRDGVLRARRVQRVGYIIQKNEHERSAAAFQTYDVAEFLLSCPFGAVFARSDMRIERSVSTYDGHRDSTLGKGG